MIRLWITEPNSVEQPVIRLFIYLILIFGSLIHAEMIVLNFWGMQTNTKLFLKEKERMEFDEIGNATNFNDSTHEGDNVDVDDEYAVNLNDLSKDSKEMVDIILNDNMVVDEFMYSLEMFKNIMSDERS